VTKLYHYDTDSLTPDLDKAEMYEYLKSGMYEFDEEKVPIHVVDPKDPKGIGMVYEQTREEARESILSHSGTYLDPDELNHWLNKFDYSDRQGTAAALGVAGALSVGILPGAMALMDEAYSDEPSLAGIMDANPGYMMASDILTTIAALAAAPKTGALSVGLAGKPLHRLGLKTLMKQAKKSPFRTLAAGAPNVVRQLGGEVEERIGSWVLKNAAEEQLKKSAWRGLLPRVGSLGTEALIYSAGYGLPQAINDKLEGRSWGDVATSYGLQMGMGTGLGIAIPGILHGTLGLGLKVAEGVRKAGAYPVRFAMESVLARDMAKTIASGASAMNPDTIFANSKKAINIAEKFTTAHLQKSAGRQMAKFTAQLNKMVKKTADMMKGAMDNQRLIRAADQVGHAVGVVKRWVGHIPANADGAANPFVLADQMISGNFASKEAGVSMGFIPKLRLQTQRLLADAQRELKPEDPLKMPTQLQHAAADELEGIIADLDAIENSVLHWVRGTPFVKQIKDFYKLGQQGTDAAEKEMQEIGKRFREWLNEPTQAGRLADFENWTKKYGKHGAGMIPEQQFILAHLSIDDWKFAPGVVGTSGARKGMLSERATDFITDTFVRLERLSARVQASITDGTIPVDDITQKWADSLKLQITEMLTNTGRTWSINGGPTAFGHMSKKKAFVNSLLRARDVQHQKLTDKFAVSVEQFPDANRIDLGKVETLLRNINHADKEHSAKMLLEYARKNKALFDYFKKNYDMSRTDLAPGLPGAIDDALSVAKDSRLEIARHITLMKTKMADALEWSAIMNADNQLSLAAGNRSLMPWSIGSGAAVGLGASALGMDADTSIALGVAAGGGKFMYDSMVNPGRAMATINKFFIAGNEFDQFITGQVDRYFTWLNKAGKYPGINRLSYIGPGGDKYGQFPSIFTSRFIADYVTGKKMKKAIIEKADLKTYEEEE
tara:strand:- start:663 stop:3512 length:2850 start_codon:yes stop_codon:yes gene_type:complete